MKRVAVVGCIGAGKSTLARSLGDTLAIPVFHLDLLWWHHGPYKITGRASVAAHTMDPIAFRNLEESITAGESWIVDGDMANLDLRIGRADTVVFLDLPRWRCLIGLIKRHNRRRPDYPDDVREGLGWLWMLARWIWRTWPTRRRNLVKRLEQLPAEVEVVHLASRAETVSFMAAPRRTG